MMGVRWVTSEMELPEMFIYSKYLNSLKRGESTSRLLLWVMEGIR